jgi:tetratricopeptide (TPR) repeat protein
VPDEDVFELVHPRCAEARAEDLQEVRAMLDAGEVDVAVDELRWLLEGCREFLEAHRLLGQIALSGGDLQLARAHFRRAYDLTLKALPEEGLGGTLPNARDANRAFFEAGKGLVECFVQLGETELADEVAQQLLALDPSDPLGIRELLGKPGG